MALLRVKRTQAWKCQLNLSSTVMWLSSTINKVKVDYLWAINWQNKIFWGATTQTFLQMFFFHFRRTSTPSATKSQPCRIEAEARNSFLIRLKNVYSHPSGNPLKSCETNESLILRAIQSLRALMKHIWLKTRPCQLIKRPSSVDKLALVIVFTSLWVLIGFALGSVDFFLFSLYGAIFERS